MKCNPLTPRTPLGRPKSLNFFIAALGDYTQVVPLIRFQPVVPSAYRHPQNPTSARHSKVSARHPLFLTLNPKSPTLNPTPASATITHHHGRLGLDAPNDRSL